jgi:hypothetical protein
VRTRTTPIEMGLRILVDTRFVIMGYPCVVIAYRPTNQRDIVIATKIILNDSEYQTFINKYNGGKTQIELRELNENEIKNLAKPVLRLETRDNQIMPYPSGNPEKLNLMINELAKWQSARFIDQIAEHLGWKLNETEQLRLKVLLMDCQDVKGELFGNSDNYTFALTDKARLGISDHGSYNEWQEALLNSKIFEVSSGLFSSVKEKEQFAKTVLDFLVQKDMLPEYSPFTLKELINSLDLEDLEKGKEVAPLCQEILFGYDLITDDGTRGDNVKLTNRGREMNSKGLFTLYISELNKAISISHTENVNNHGSGNVAYKSSAGGDFNQPSNNDSSTKTTTTQSQKSLWSKILEMILDLKKWFKSFIIVFAAYLIKELF